MSDEVVFFLPAYGMKNTSNLYRFAYSSTSKANYPKQKIRNILLDAGFEEVRKGDNHWQYVHPNLLHKPFGRITIKKIQGDANPATVRDARNAVKELIEQKSLMTK